MSATEEAVILSAARTPIGKFLGALSPLSAVELGALAFRAALERSGVNASEIDEAILGNVVSAGLGMAPARNAALKAGLPDTLPCFTVNKVCGSGLKAVMLAAQAIKAGDAKAVLAGGAESMSNAPHLIRGVRSGIAYGNAKLEDSLLTDGLECCVEHWHMGNAAEHIAARFGITRAEMDRYAFESHKKASAAQESGAFAAEIVPVSVPQKKGAALSVERDEGPRADASIDKLATLKPAFSKDGFVTAGNASTLNDGAAAVVVASADFARGRGLKPLAKIRSYAASGVAPKEIFHAPALAIPAALRKAELELKDIGLIELNEAFAAQVLANKKVLNLDETKLNVNGGAIALGHPLGASGARCLVTLIHAMKARGVRFGVAALCLGGGNAVAMVVENV
ncbi:MAG TPA: acetyl-CoA C-acyltransferase [Planctomycetota bacterium]|nr:acetyl-CoA C-acyltransferase [Planctomycetota bacterium]